MEVFISEAEVDDAIDIIDYLNIVVNESDNLTFDKDECNFNELQEMSIIQEYQEDAKSVMLLGFVDDEIAALGSLTTYSKNRLKHRSELGISVRKDFWNMGIATALMEELIEFAKDNDIEIIELQVRNDNVNAIKLYQNFGFENIGIYKNYFKIDNKYYDFNLMNLYLK